MDESRLDDLLEAALRDGHVPAEATPDEAAALVRLLEAAGAVRNTRPAILNEAARAERAGRARFDRFIAGQVGGSVVTSLPVPAPTRQPARLRALASRPRRVALLAAGLAVVLVLAAIGGAQLANRQVETVSALSPGDYVELEGVVSATPGADGSVSVASGIGSLAVELTGETSLREGAMTVGREALRPGRGVVISGTVDNEGRIAAHAIAVREEGSRPLPGGGPLRPLPGREEEGTIVAVSVASEGGQARVTIQTEGGESFVAIIDGDAAEELLRLGSAIGTRVSLTPRADGGPPHVEVRQSAPPGTGIARFRGVVVSREGPVFVLEARDGPVEVVIGPHTRVLAGGLAIAVERILSGEEALEGRMLTVGGGVENGTGRILANVIIIGREMP